MSKKICIVGSGGEGLTALRIAELQKEGIEVVKAEDLNEDFIKERGLIINKPIEYELPKLIDEYEHFTPPETRAERRKRLRNTK